MATATMVPLQEYLHTMYHPDCDWVDGELRERNWGEGSHSAVTTFLVYYLWKVEEEWGVRVWPSLRTQVSTTRFRVPDVCLTAKGNRFEEILRTPPILCIEVLSPADGMSDLFDKIDDYFKMGVSAVWVVDPWRRRAYCAKASGTMQAEPEMLSVEATSIRVPVNAIFDALDDVRNDRMM